MLTSIIMSHYFILAGQNAIKKWKGLDIHNILLESKKENNSSIYMYKKNDTAQFLDLFFHKKPRIPV